MTFNATKTKLLSFNRHRDPPLVPVEMNSIELPEEIIFLLLGLTFARCMDWKPYIQSIVKAVSRKVDSLYWVQLFLTPESILYLYKSTIWPCMEYCSHIWDDVARFHGLGLLLDRVQKQVVSLVGYGLSSDLQALSHRRDVSSLSLFYMYYCGKCSSELADNVPPKRVTVRALDFLSRCIVIQLILLCAAIVYQSCFFPARQPFGTSSLMNDLTAFKGRVNKVLLLKRPVSLTFSGFGLICIKKLNCK